MSVSVRSIFRKPSDSPIADHRTILKYWEEKRGDKFAPSWRDISLMELPPTSLPTLSVTDITEKPLASVFRYWGRDLTTVFGRDFTGSSPTEVPPKSVGLSAEGGCGRLVHERFPHLEIKEFTNQKGIFGRAIVLRLPLSDDGVHVNHGINVYCFESLKKDSKLSDFFDEVFSKLIRVA